MTKPGTPALYANRLALRTQRGYALLMVMIMATMMLVAASAVAVNVLTQGRRQREAELAWRGNQYVRAVRLYFKKNGRFPQSLEDLTKYTTDQPRYIRKAYKDPMNTDDGSWRLIYVTANGVLIGSVMHKTLYGGALPGTPQQGPPGAPGSNGNPPVGATPPGGTTPTVGGNTPGTAGGTPQQPGGTDQNQPGQDQSTVTGQVFGGNLIGVGSKVKQDSIRVYKNGITYLQWEFICDPTEPGNTCATSGQGIQPAGPTGQPGQPAQPGQPGQPVQPGTQPPNTQQNQPQQPPQQTPLVIKQKTSTSGH